MNDIVEELDNLHLVLEFQRLNLKVYPENADIKKNIQVIKEDIKAIEEWL